MKSATKIIFASRPHAFGRRAEPLSLAGYLVDQTKTWATTSRAQDVMGKKVRVDGALDAMAYAPAGLGDECLPGLRNWQPALSVPRKLKRPNLRSKKSWQ